MSDDEEMFGSSPAALPPSLRNVVLGGPGPQVAPDVRSSGAIVLRSPEEARALARRISGAPSPDRGIFWCMTCGFNDGGVSKYPGGLTLHFDAEELEALGGDPYAYSGPCPVCQSMTLVSMQALGGGTTSIYSQAEKNRKQDVSEAAEVFLDKVQERVGSIFTGGLGGVAEKIEQAEAEVSGQRPDLPPADDIDISKMKPR